MVERPNEAGYDAEELSDSGAHVGRWNYKDMLVGLHANGMLMCCTPISCQEPQSAFALVK
jgi:hypothetical protein